MGNIYYQRMEEFGAAYEDFEPSDVTSLMAQSGEWLSLLLADEKLVDEVMQLIYDRVIGPSVIGNDGASRLPWRELWADVGLNDAMMPQRSQYMVELNAFAFWGLPLDTKRQADTIEGNIERVEAFVAEARAFLDAIPPRWENISNIAPTVLAAEARVRIDTGRGVTPEQLAALARISLKSVRNLLTPKGGVAEVKLNEAGEIPGADALRWLEKRPDFKSSLWKQAPVGATMADAAAPEAIDLGETTFVPVAKDGSWFDPVTCRNGRGYTIGPKGSEIPVDDYHEALARLARMGTPYWRRPNSAGNWGLVAGATWQRKVVSELMVPGQGDR